MSISSSVKRVKSDVVEESFFEASLFEVSDFEVSDFEVSFFEEDVSLAVDSLVAELLELFPEHAAKVTTDKSNKLEVRIFS